MPLPDRGDAHRHLFETQERFLLLRRLGIEGMYLTQQGRLADSSLLLEVGALVTNRLSALARSLPGGRPTRQSFLELVQSQVKSHLEKGASDWERGSGLKSLRAAQGRLDEIERSMPPGAVVAEAGAVRSCAVECAVFIALFLEAWWHG